MAIPGGVKRGAPRGLARHPRHPVPAVTPHPEIQRSAPPPRRPVLGPPAPRRRVGVFAQPIQAPTRRLTRPAPVKRAERRLPPAPMPSYPVLRHYTKAQQRTIVQGTQRAGNRVADRGAIRPGALAPLSAVRRQQQAAANRRYASRLDVPVSLGQAGGRELSGVQHGMTPQQAALLRRASNLRSQLRPGSLQNLLTSHGFDLSSYLSSPEHNLLVAGYPGVRGFLENAGQLSRVGGDYGRKLGAVLRHAGADVSGGRGTVGGLTPGFLRAPIGAELGVLGTAAPVAGRLAGGAMNNLTQFTLGAIPGVAQLGGLALNKGPLAAGGALLHGFEDVAKHPLDNPLFALQMLHGGIRGVSRTAGALGRSPVSPAALQRALNTTRAPLQIAGPAATRLLEYRHYSKDPLVMAMQKRADRKLDDGALVRDQHGREVRAKVAPTAEVGGGPLKTLRASLISQFGQDTRGRLRSYGDFVADRANAVERHNRAVMQHELVKMMPTRGHRGGRVGQAVGGYIDRMLHSSPEHDRMRLPRRAYRPERDVVGMVMSGLVRGVKTWREDLTAELQRLEKRAEGDFVHPEERALNQARQQTIRRVLADRRAMDPKNVKRFVDAGRALAVRARELTEHAVKQGALTRDAAERAPLFEYAMRHMGARYYTAEDHAHAERLARGTERVAHKTVQKAEIEVRKAERLLAEHDRRNAPQHATAPQGDNFLNRPHEREQLDDLQHEHAQLLETYNHLARRGDQLREQMNAIPAGPEREAFRKNVYRPASDEFQRVDTEARKLHNEIARRKDRLRQANSGELVTGQPERPVREITWYHGTPTAFEDLPSAVGKDNDLGVYLTSDPHYAGGYGTHGFGGAGDSPGIQIVHVNPRKVLETRFGRVNPDEIATVIERLLKRADETANGLEQRIRAEFAHRDRLAAESLARGETGARKADPAFVEHQVSLARDNALAPSHRETLERWLRLLREDKATRDAVSGKTPLKTSIENASLSGWQELDKTLMRYAPGDIMRGERLHRYPGREGSMHAPPALGVSHQPTRLILRELGYDAVRKVDQHADSLVVVNESVLRRPGHPTPRPTGQRASVQLGSSLEAQGFERAAGQHGLHVHSTHRKGDGIVAHVQGDREAIDRLAAQHAHRTDSNVLAFHHDPEATGHAYMVTENGQTTYYFDSTGDPAYAEQVRAAHPGAEITATPGAGRILTPEDHATFARHIQTPRDQARHELHNRVESARRAHREARAAHAAARHERIAVSGRDPELVRRHEAAVAEAATARQAMKRAQAAHARAEAARHRTVGVQSSRRGRRQAEALGTDLKITTGERPTGRATAAEQRQLAAHEPRITAAREARVAAEKAHREALARIPARPDAAPALRKADGTLLTNEEIHAHMREAGIPFDERGPQIAYLPHRPDTNTRANYHRSQALLRRDTVETGFHRTGEAFNKGVTGASFDLVADHMIRQAITTGDGAIGQFDRLAREAGHVNTDGRPFTPQEAEVALQNLNNIPGQPKMVMVRLMPARYSETQRMHVQRMQNPEALDPTHYGGDFSTYVERSFADRVAKAGEPAPAWMKERGTRNVALMPEELVNRFQQHLSALSNRSPTGALLAKGFRTAVLPFSVKWLTGNVAEAVLRLAMIGGNPLDYIAGRRTMTTLRGREPKDVLGHRVLNGIIGLDVEHAGVAAEVGSSILGGLLYGEPGLTVHRGVSDYEHTNMRVPAQVIGGLAHTTMLREIGHELNRIPQTIFHFNRILEQQAQYVAFGRYVRKDIQEFTGSYLKSVTLQKRAIEDAARGLFNTAAQRDAARYVDETLGKYSRFSPRLRAFIQTATPFLPWYLNAARFVFWTMPMKHPTKTALLLATEKAFQKDWEDQHKDLPPGELKSAVKSGGGWRDLARFTPFGAFTGVSGGDPSPLISPFFPQVQGIVHAIEGQDPFGRPMQVPKTPDNPKGRPTSADITKAAINAGLGAFFPGYSPGQRLAEHGETAYGNSSLLFGIHTKPNSSHGYSGFRRLTDPFRPVYLRKKAGTVSTTSNGMPDYSDAIKRGTGAASQLSPSDYGDILKRASGR